MHEQPYRTGLILLIEQDKDLADVTIQLLELDGHTIHHVRSARDAQLYMAQLPASGGIPPALLLLGDLSSEDEVLTLLELLDSSVELKPRILLFSALPKHRLERLAERIRAVGILVKPFDTDHLRLLVKSALRIEQ